MSIEDAYNFRRVSPTLSTSGIPRPGQLEGLSAEGYEAVVNLLPDTSEHAVAGERDIVESQGLEYVHIPVDFGRPARADFERFAETLDRLGSRKVHVHCAANYRVSAFYSRYAVRRGLWSDAQAQAFVRDVWDPQEYPPWPEFIAALR